MHCLRYEIALRSKVLVSGYSPDQNMTETLEYLPGTTILGMFASKYIHNKGLYRGSKAHEDADFYRWFLKGDICFSNAYISKQGIETIPTPLYIQKEKEHEILHNILLKDDIENTKPIGGFSKINKGSIQYINPRKRISFHHERDRLSGSKKGIFFNYEALMPGQIFKGGIYGDIDELNEFKNAFEEKFSARIGKSKGAEYGAVEVRLMSIDKVNNIDEDEYDLEEIFLVFISPCILFNEFGMADPSIYNLKAYLENIFGKDSFEIQGSIIRQDRIENYISVWKMKKPMERAIGIGSAVYIRFEDMNENIINGIQNLLERGIGERTGEGFGRVHIDMDNIEIYKRKEVSIEIEKPEGQIPKEAICIFTTVIKEELFKKAEYIAVEHAETFRNSPPNNSLIGKLILMLADVDSKDNISSKRYIEKLSQLKDKAMGQLKNCNNKGRGYIKKQSLYEYIEEHDEEKVWKLIKSEMTAYDKLIELSGFDIENDPKLIRKLWTKYMQNFLKEIWRKNKQISQQEGEEYAK